MNVAKWNRRLVVMQEGRVAYYPPHFLKNYHRHDLEVVAQAGATLEAIMAFEDKFNPRLR